MTKRSIFLGSLALFLGLGCGTSNPNGPDIDLGGGGSNASPGGTGGDAAVDGGNEEENGGGGLDAGQDDTLEPVEAGTGGTASGGSGGGSGSGANGGSSGSSGSGGSKDSGPNGPNFDYDAPVFVPEACAGSVAEAEPAPLDIYLMLDRSSSMGTDCDVESSTASKWCRAINAIAQYVNSSGADGHSLAIGYFPGSGTYNCTAGTGCAYLGVDLGELPGNASAIISSMNSVNPSGSNTPTQCALNNMVTFTKTNARPGHAMIGILVTDGQPEGSCDNTDGTLADIVKKHFEETGIHTFIIGMQNAVFSSIETWASYPGAIVHPNNSDTPCGNGASTCRHYNVGSGNGAVFENALAAIQKSVIGCTFLVPEPETGILNLDSVGVDHNGTSLDSFGSETDCTGPGWYFDDPVHPSTINLCPDTCTSVKTDEHASVEITIACEGN